MGGSFEFWHQTESQTIMNLPQWLSVYRQQIANLDDYDTPDELELAVFQVLSTRDWFANQTLNDDQVRELAELDDQLRAHADVLADFLPGPNPPGRAHWWWYLHEGPQVRVQAA